MANVDLLSSLLRGGSPDARLSTMVGSRREAQQLIFPPSVDFHLALLSDPPARIHS